MSCSERLTRAIHQSVPQEFPARVFPSVSYQEWPTGESVSQEPRPASEREECSHKSVIPRLSYKILQECYRMFPQECHTTSVVPGFGHSSSCTSFSPRVEAIAQDSKWLVLLVPKARELFGKDVYLCQPTHTEVGSAWECYQNVPLNMLIGSLLRSFNAGFLGYVWIFASKTLLPCSNWICTKVCTFLSGVLKVFGKFSSYCLDCEM